MDFSFPKTLEILERTPQVLDALMGGLSDSWTQSNEGENTWSPKEVLAHLIVCEKTDWMVRARIILEGDPSKSFEPIDMEAHFELARNRDLSALFAEFKKLREASLAELQRQSLSEIDFARSALHPKLGQVTLKELLATWAVHDLSHTAQIAKVMAKQYKESVGPFAAFLSILNR